MKTRALAAAVLLLAAPALGKKAALGPGERIDLNTANAAELMRLPGVGKKRAQAIVAWREKHPFRRPEEVARVRGLSAGWFARVKAHLVAGLPVAAPKKAP